MHSERCNTTLGAWSGRCSISLKASQLSLELRIAAILLTDTSGTYLLLQ